MTLRVQKTRTGACMLEEYYRVNHVYRTINVLYKRVVITSESSAPPTLRTSTRVYLNHLIR
jgi:hypothetical protein